MPLLILIFVLFISISPSIASILPTDAAPHTSNMAVDSNLADAIPSASVSTSAEPEPELKPELKPEPELKLETLKCKPWCKYDSAIGKCVSRIPPIPC